MTTTALERLERSRECLRRAMLPPAAVPRPAPGRFGPFLQRLRGWPLVAESLDALAAWWWQHPLRPLAQVAGDASNAVARPLAQRHPLLLVLAAGLSGAALAWSRPWRWIFGSALFAGLVPQFAARIVARLPIDSWLTMLGAQLSRATPPADAAPMKARRPPAP